MGSGKVYSARISGDLLRVRISQLNVGAWRDTKYWELEGELYTVWVGEASYLSVWVSWSFSSEVNCFCSDLASCKQASCSA